MNAATCLEENPFSPKLLFFKRICNSLVLIRLRLSSITVDKYTRYSPTILDDGWKIHVRKATPVKYGLFVWAALPLAWCVMNEDMMTEAERALKLTEPNENGAPARGKGVFYVHTL